MNYPFEPPQTPESRQMWRDVYKYLQTIPLAALWRHRWKCLHDQTHDRQNNNVKQLFHKTKGAEE